MTTPDVPVDVTSSEVAEVDFLRSIVADLTRQLAEARKQIDVIDVLHRLLDRAADLVTSVPPNWIDYFKRDRLLSDIDTAGVPMFFPSTDAATPPAQDTGETECGHNPRPSAGREHGR